MRGSGQRIVLIENDLADARVNYHFSTKQTGRERRVQRGFSDGDAMVGGLDNRVFFPMTAVAVTEIFS